MYLAFTHSMFIFQILLKYLYLCYVCLTGYLQRQLGANLDVAVSYEWLTFFMEDDQELAEIARKYKCGEMLTGELKKILIGILQVSGCMGGLQCTCYYDWCMCA